MLLGDTGFGNILTKKLDKMGFSVIPGVYMEDSITKLKSECSSNVYPFQVDVSSEESVYKVADQIKSLLLEKGGKLHGIVNNAGILVQPGPFEWTPLDAYKRMFNVNVMGTVMTSKSLLPLIRSSQGRIINVASIAGRVGLPTQPAYCMSKFGVEGFSEVLRTDMYPWGVTVHIVEPGVFKATGLYQTFETGLDKLWNDLDEETKAAYGKEFYEKLREGMVKSLAMGNTNSELVVDGMIHALVDSKPKYRYKIGLDSKYIIPFLEKCHESVQDGVIGGTWRHNVKPSAAPENGKQLAMGRYHKAWTRFIMSVLVLLFVGKKLRNSL